MATYFTDLQTNAGANPLNANPCTLLDFQLVELGDGQTHSGNTGDREVLAVLFGPLNSGGQDSAVAISNHIHVRPELSSMRSYAPSGSLPSA